MCAGWWGDSAPKQMSLKVITRLDRCCFNLLRVLCFAASRFCAPHIYARPKWSAPPREWLSLRLVLVRSLRAPMLRLGCDHRYVHARRRGRLAMMCRARAYNDDYPPAQRALSLYKKAGCADISVHPAVIFILPSAQAARRQASGRAPLRLSARLRAPQA